MKCDICNTEYDYSEEVIYHITAEINGKLKPHTHICKECFNEYDLKPIKITTVENNIKTTDEYKYFYIELARKHNELETDEIIEMAEKYTKEFLQTPESKHESSLLQLIYNFMEDKDDIHF